MDETPRFCTILESYLSDIFYSKLNPIEKLPINIDNLKSINSNCNNKKKESDISSKEIKKKYLLDNRNYQIHNNIQEFMKKNKFFLRNDFDENNVEKFLLSKEQAFNNPFLVLNDIIENKE